MSADTGQPRLPRRARIFASWLRGVDRAVWAGALVSLVCGLGLFLLPYLFPFPAFQEWYFQSTGQLLRENPLLVVRYFGGLPGGYVAARFVDDWRWEHRLLAGVGAALFAVVAVFALFVGYNVGSALSEGVSPPVPYIVVASLVFAVGLLPMYALGGAVGAVAAHLRRSYR